MASAELLLEAFYLRVGIAVGAIELAPGAAPATEAESEIVGLPDRAALFIIGSDGALERLRGEDAVGLELWIAGLVVVAVGLELPLSRQRAKPSRGSRSRKNRRRSACARAPRR